MSDPAPAAAAAAAKLPDATVKGLQLVHELADKEGVVEAPTDIAIESTKPLELPALTWRNYGNLPAKLVVTNTGHTGTPRTPCP